MKISNKKKIIGLKEFRQNTEAFIDRVNKGESFTVLKRSNPVFKIIPIEDEEIWETVIDFTKMNKKGVKVQDVIKAIKSIHG